MALNLECQTRIDDSSTSTDEHQQPKLGAKTLRLYQQETQRLLYREPASLTREWPEFE